jgi:hypothetical protein
MGWSLGGGLVAGETATQRFTRELAAADDPAIRWFANELDLPCAPGWSGFLCNQKDLPLGQVPLDLPPVTEPVRLNPVAMDLVRLNAVQPPMVPPLAPVGFKLVDLPTDLAAQLKQYMQGQLKAVKDVPKDLGAPDARSRIISKDADDVFHSRVTNMPQHLKKSISDHFEKAIGEWIGMPLTYSAGFGARTYLRNATFAAHVDRYDTHVASAIVNLAQVRWDPWHSCLVPPVPLPQRAPRDSAGGGQDVDVDWPVVITDHSGVAHSVPLHAGQALMYESARCLHSRPHPLQGRWYSNFFIHFRPQGWEEYLKSDRISERIEEAKREWKLGNLGAARSPHAARVAASDPLDK